MNYGAITVQIKKLTTMTFEEGEQITNKNSDDLLSQLIYYQGEYLMSEILRLGI